MSEQVMLSLKALDMNEAELMYFRTGHAQSQSSRYDWSRAKVCQKNMCLDFTKGLDFNHTFAYLLQIA